MHRKLRNYFCRLNMHKINIINYIAKIDSFASESPRGGGGANRSRSASPASD